MPIPVPLPMFSFTGSRGSFLGDANFYGKAVSGGTRTRSYPVVSSGERERERERERGEKRRLAGIIPEPLDLLSDLTVWERSCSGDCQQEFRVRAGIGVSVKEGYSVWLVYSGTDRRVNCLTESEAVSLARCYDSHLSFWHLTAHVQGMPDTRLGGHCANGYHRF